MKIPAKCDHCKKGFMAETGQVNRARIAGFRLFCGRKCSGLGRRKNKSKAQKIAEKAAYDVEYRANNLATITAKKAAYFQRTYDPTKAAVERKSKMAQHIEYCRQPKYRKWKAEYDRQLRANEYGPFAEAYTIVLELNRTIKGRMTNYEIYSQNGTLNKRQARRRQSAEAIGRYHSRSVDG